MATQTNTNTGQRRAIDEQTALYYGVAAARSAYGTESDELEAFEFWLGWFMKRYDAEQIAEFYRVVIDHAE